MFGRKGVGVYRTRVDVMAYEDEFLPSRRGCCCEVHAIRRQHKWILDAVAAELVFGNIEERSFRVCGREIVPDEDFSVPSNKSANQ